MPRKPQNFEHLFPAPEAILLAMRAASPQFMRCPGGHDLPHRVSWGRCSPMDCCDYGQVGTKSIGKNDPARVSHENTIPYKNEMDMLPVGMEGEVLKRPVSGTGEAAYVAGHAAEAILLLKAQGAAAAREAVHPMPEIPPPPNLKEIGATQYVKQRLEQISPWLLEQRIADARFAKTDKERTEIIADLMDRAGHGRKPENSVTVNVPVVFVKGQFTSPYEKQKEEGKTINGQVVGREQADLARNAAVRAAQQSDAGRKLLAEFGWEPEDDHGEHAEPGGVGQGAASAGGD